jgi:hypothetical protein
MPNLAAALMAAADKYEKGHIRADFCIGTYKGNSVVIYTGSGQSIELDADREVMYTELFLWHTLFLKHDHNGTVPPDLINGVAGRVWHPDEPKLTEYKLPNPIRPHCDKCWTIQEKLFPGDTLLMMRVASGKQYIALSKLYSHADTQG